MNRRFHILSRLDFPEEIDPGARIRMQTVILTAILRAIARTAGDRAEIITSPSEATESVRELFSPSRFHANVDAYAIPSYRDGGAPVAIPVKSKGQKRGKVALTEEIQEALTGYLSDQPLDPDALSDPAVPAARRQELVQWTYDTFFAPDKPLKPSAQARLLGQIENKVVVPFLRKELRTFYESLQDQDSALPLAPEVEYALLPDKVREAVSGGAAGWADIRDEVAAHLETESPDNLLSFYGMTPQGKMAEVRLWSDREPILVHADLVPVLKQVAGELARLGPSLQVLYPDFWSHRSALGLQVRHIHGVKTLSYHTLGKAIDTSPTLNPHLKDPRLLTVLGWLGGIDASASVRAYEKRHALLRNAHQALLEGKAASEDFKAFMQEAEARYTRWVESQAKFKSAFPHLTRDSDRAVALKTILDRVKEERAKVDAKLKGAAQAVTDADQHLAELEKERSALTARLASRHAEQKLIVKQLRQMRKELKETPKAHRTPQMETAISDTEKHRSDLEQDIQRGNTRRKELGPLKRAARKAVTAADKDYASIKKESEFLEKLGQDLVGDDDLVFREQVINPGLEVLAAQGYLNIPWEVVRTFLEHGFDWGGLWSNPDFMHFEWTGPVSGEL